MPFPTLSRTQPCQADLFLMAHPAVTSQSGCLGEASHVGKDDFGAICNATSTVVKLEMRSSVKADDRMNAQHTRHGQVELE